MQVPGWLGAEHRHIRGTVGVELQIAPPTIAIQDPEQAAPWVPVMIPGFWQNPLLQLFDPHWELVVQGAELGRPPAQPFGVHKSLAQSALVIQEVPEAPLQSVKPLDSEVQRNPGLQGHNWFKLPVVPVAHSPLQIKPKAQSVKSLHGEFTGLLHTKELASQMRSVEQEVVVQEERKAPTWTGIVLMGGVLWEIA